ncbi:hypothetical protein [Thalassovita taeanensis]|uniref:Uncharacterized protein n=1 Tax=Thalassovita taeanensis TaxID=657014 RepID=A0A1H8ZHP5_9RHOB|nr:hypothetical protein [Thalassovita taeanensis]SEP63258.1 hypothetical protein SAMN04488092_101431 [Thalassovita taeanensis]
MEVLGRRYQELSGLRVLVHAGFHKTGTTTLQRTMQANRAVLSRQVNFLLPSDLDKIGHFAKRYSMKANEATLLKLKADLRMCLSRFSHQPDTPIFLSCEALAGQMPGRKGVWSYGQTHRILEAVVEEITQTLGSSADVVI